MGLCLACPRRHNKNRRIYQCAYNKKGHRTQQAKKDYKELLFAELSLRSRQQLRDSHCCQTGNRARQKRLLCRTQRASKAVRTGLFSVITMKHFTVFLINLYRQLFAAQRMVARCKYHPSCSEYTILAVKKYGAITGLVKSAWRILRCNPLTKGGVDLP